MDPIVRKYIKLLIIVLKRSIYCFDDQVTRLERLFGSDYSEEQIHATILQVEEFVESVNPAEFTSVDEKIVDTGQLTDTDYRIVESISYMFDLLLDDL